MEEKQIKQKSRTKTKPQRVAVADERGEIARPFESDIDIWLAKGWKRVNEDQPQPK